MAILLLAGLLLPPLLVVFSLFLCLLCSGAQFDFAPPFISPLSMMHLQPPPTEVDPGEVFEFSLFRSALAGQLASGENADATLVCADGELPVHRSILAAAGALSLLEPGAGARLKLAQARTLLTYLYAGHVGQALLQGTATDKEVGVVLLGVLVLFDLCCVCQTLEQDARLLAELMEAGRAAGLAAVARAVQRSVVLRIGLGGPAHADGYNPDLELLARAALLAHLFDEDFRLVLGHFAYNNFQALLSYHEARARLGLFAVDRAAMVRALCDVLPGGESGEKKKKKHF